MGLSVRSRIEGKLHTFKFKTGNPEAQISGCVSPLSTGLWDCRDSKCSLASLTGTSYRCCPLCQHLARHRRVTSHHNNAKGELPKQRSCVWCNGYNYDCHIRSALLVCETSILNERWRYIRDPPSFWHAMLSLLLCSLYKVSHSLWTWDRILNCSTISPLQADAVRDRWRLPIMWCIAISVVESQHIKFGETCSGRFLFCCLLINLPNKMWVRLRNVDITIFE